MSHLFLDGSMEPFLDINVSLRDFLFFIIVPLTIVFVVAFIIGLERQNIGKAAGISAHVLVGLSATSIAIMQRFLAIQGGNEVVNSEGQRVIAQVISGIGFIGAGVILKDPGNIIRGITTAATIWTVAMIGLVFGSGFIVLGTTLSTVVLLFIFIRDLKRGINPLKEQSHKSVVHEGD